MPGLMKAPELYQYQQQDRATPEALLPALGAINALTGFAADIEQDEAERAIWRIRIKVDAVLLGLNAREVIALLHNGEIVIYPRCYALHLGVFSLDPSTLAQVEQSLIVERLAEIAKQQGQ